jgi:hypothetical protein
MTPLKVYALKLLANKPALICDYPISCLDAVLSKKLVNVGPRTRV